MPSCPVAPARLLSVTVVQGGGAHVPAVMRGVRHIQTRYKPGSELVDLDGHQVGPNRPHADHIKEMFSSAIRPLVPGCDHDMPSVRGKVRYEPVDIVSIVEDQQPRVHRLPS
jgi:hypothetical protein